MSLKLTLAPRNAMLSMHGDTYVQPPRTHFESTVGAIVRFFFILLSVMLLVGLAVA